MNSVTITDNGIFMPKKEAQRFSEKVQHIVREVLAGEFVGWEDYASMSVYDLIESCAEKPERKLGDAALLIFNSDWKSIVEKLKRLQIYVDGYCPKCGTQTEEQHRLIRCATQYSPDEYEYWHECPKCGLVIHEAV